MDDDNSNLTGMESAETPIVINADPKVAQLTSTIRTVIQLGGMWLVSRSVIANAGDVDFALGVAGIVVPWAYNQWRIRKMREKITKLVRAVDDSIAVFK